MDNPASILFLVSGVTLIAVNLSLMIAGVWYLVSTRGMGWRESRPARRRLDAFSGGLVCVLWMALAALLMSFLAIAETALRSAY